MTDLVEIKAERRTSAGKSFCRKLRKSGLIPGNILDAKNPEMIELSPKWLPVAWKSGKKFMLNLDGKTTPVMIKELQLSRVSRVALHVDLVRT